MSKKTEVEALSSGKTPRFAIFDLVSGKPYVMVVYPNEEMAQRELCDLLKPYSDDHFWRTRLGVRRTDGCGAKGPKGMTCNLAEGHEAPHAQVTWFSPAGRTSSVWFDK
jgi:hypothetical protein